MNGVAPVPDVVVAASDVEGPAVNGVARVPDVPDVVARAPDVERRCRFPMW